MSLPAWAALRFVNGGKEYFATVIRPMDTTYQPFKTAYSVPETEGELPGIYSSTNSWNRDGTQQGMGMPGAGGLEVHEEEREINLD
ncbi:hypothetical protein [Streptomyces sparsus]